MNEAALRERIEYLEADNANLRARLRLQANEDFVASVRAGLGTSPAGAKLLWALWDSKVKTREALFEALYGDKLDQPEIHVVFVHLCHLRKALANFHATVKTHSRTGFQLTPADRAKIAAHIGIEVKP